MMDRIQSLGQAVATSLRQGFEWWIGELAAMSPWRFGAKTADAPVVLHVAGSGATLVLNRRGGGEPQRLPVGALDDEAHINRLRSAVRSRRRGQDVVIRLDPSLVLETEIALPFGAEAALRPILTNQLERLVPLSAEEVEFAYSVAPRTPASKTLRVHLTIATRAVLDSATQTARVLGLAPRRIVVPSGAPWDDGMTVLRRAGASEQISPGQRRLYRVLEVAAVLLLLAGYGLYLNRLDTVIADLQDDAQQKTRLAAAARALGRQQQQTEGVLDMLQKRQRDRTPLMVLNGITDLIPLDSWLLQLTVRGRDVEITGFSPRVADIITRVENSDLFTGPRFRSPVTLSPDGKSQRYNLSFQIVPESGDP